MIKILKKITFSFILLYSYNLIASSFNLIIPINYISIFIVTILDFPGIALLGIILKLFY
jgi:pro-sigmaK processing inhibitor BofA